MPGGVAGVPSIMEAPYADFGLALAGIFKHQQVRFCYGMADGTISSDTMRDTLVVWRLDRLGRSLPDLVGIVPELEARGVGFESLAGKIETTSASGKLIFHLFVELAEFECNLINERTKAGLAAARARGRFGGRKPKLDAKQIQRINVLLGDPAVRVADLARDYGVSRTTIYKHCGVVLLHG